MPSEVGEQMLLAVWGWPQSTVKVLGVGPLVLEASTLCILKAATRQVLSAPSEASCPMRLEPVSHNLVI